MKWLLVVGAAVGLALATGTRSEAAAGQELVPDEAQPVLELLAPIAWPGCADATIATLAVPVVLGALGLPVPTEVLQATGPVLVVCGSVPAPSGRRTCEVDSTLEDALATITAAAVGSPVPLLVEPAGMAVGEIVVLDDRLPAPGTGLPATADGVLRCAPAASPGQSGPSGPGPATPAPTTTAPAPATAAAPTTSGLAPVRPSAPQPGVTTPPPATTRAAIPEVALPAATAVVTIPRFAYPIVLMVPLVVLGLAGFAARALTQPLELTGRPSWMSTSPRRSASCEPPSR